MYPRLSATSRTADRSTAEDEYVIIRNVGDEEVDITGFSINFEAGEDSNVDQIRELDGEVVSGPGEEVTVATGDETTIDADVELVDPYDGFVLNNEDPDVVALLDENQNIVVSSEGEAQDEGDEEDTDDGDEDDTDPGDDDEEDPGAGEDPGDDDEEDPGDRGDTDTDDEEMDEDEDEDAAATDDEKDEKEHEDEGDAETDDADDEDDDCPKR